MKQELLELLLEFNTYWNIYGERLDDRTMKPFVSDFMEWLQVKLAIEGQENEQ